MKPFPFQKDTVYQTERKFDGRALIANDMGLGKTACALWFIKRKRLGKTTPFLCVVPRTVRPQWIDAIKQLLGFTPDILETRKPPKNGEAVTKGAVINPDIIAHWRDWLEDQRFQTIILDECHMYIDPERKRTIVATALVRQAPFALGLSGTPLTNRPKELYPIIKALNPKAWPTKKKFLHRYCGPQYTRFGWQFNGASNIEELNRKLTDACMVRYRLGDVMDQLPPKERIIVPLPLTDPQEYNDAKKDFIGWMRKKYPKRLTGAVKAAALVKSGHLLRLAAKLKLKYAVKWINHYLRKHPNEKILIYATHHKCVDALKNKIQANSVVVNGKVIGKKRDQVVEQWKRDRTTRVLIGNTIAAGVGLNLTEASSMFVVELMYKPGPLLQIEARINRIGQQMLATVYYFIAKNTIEMAVSRLLQKKQRTIGGVLDGDEGLEDFDIYDQLLEELAGEIKPSTRRSRH